MKTLKERMFELAQGINFCGNTGAKEQFLNNIKTAPNWSISRNRFWGAPIPIWKKEYVKPPREVLNEWQKQGINQVLLEKIGKHSGLYYHVGKNELLAVFGSVFDLELFFYKDYIIDYLDGRNSGKYIVLPKGYTKEQVVNIYKNNGEKALFEPTDKQPPISFQINDLHRPYIDELVKYYSDGSCLKRVEGVLDCWFESGSMPYAQVHYPFAFNKIEHYFKWF